MINSWLLLPLMFTHFSILALNQVQFSIRSIVLCKLFECMCNNYQKSKLIILEIKKFLFLFWFMVLLKFILNILNRLFCNNIYTFDFIYYFTFLYRWMISILSNYICFHFEFYQCFFFWFFSFTFVCEFLS